MKTKITATHIENRPYIGQHCTVYGKECIIFAIHAFGTIDVVTADGERAWRISGLAF
jgi:hypothetical protein